MVKQKIVAGTMGIADGTNKRINPFVGGNGLWRCQGFHFDEQGSLTKWGGMAKGPAANLMYSGQPIRGLYKVEFVIENPPEYLTNRVTYYAVVGPVGSSGKIYYQNFLSSVWTEITLPFTYSFTKYGTGGTVYNGVLYLGNRYSEPYGGPCIRIDTPAYPVASRLGIIAPSTAATDNAAAGGSMTVGTYSYKVTFYNSTIGQESNPSPVSGGVTLTSGNQQVSLSTIPVSGDTQVNRRRLYRTAVNGGVWLYLGEIADNTTTTYSDNASDSSLGIAIEETANGSPPSGLGFLIGHKGRLWGALESSTVQRIYFSSENKTGSFDSNDFRDLIDNTGIISGFKEFLGTLFVFKRSSIWTLSGTDRNTFSFAKQLHGIGCESSESIVTVENRFLFFYYNGKIYRYDGTTATDISEPIKSILSTLDTDAPIYMRGFHYEGLNSCAWLVRIQGEGGTSPANNYILLYDYNKNQWGTRALPKYGESVFSDIYNDIEKIYIGGSDGYTRQLNTGTSDDGTAIVCEVIDRAIPRDLADATQKNFFEVEVFFAPNTGSVTVSYKLNTPSETAGDFTTIGTIDTSAAKGSARLRFNAVGQRIYLRFYESSTTNTVVLRGWHVYYKILGRES